MAKKSKFLSWFGLGNKESAKKEEEARLAKEQEQAQEQARLEQEKAEAEEQARIAQEKAEAEEQARIAQEKAEAEEQARIAQEKAEAAEQARIAQEKAEAEEQARIAQEKAEAEEQAHIAQEKAEAEEQARIAQEQAEAEEQARIAQEKAEAAEQARIAQEKAEAAEQARIAQEKAEAEEQARIAQEKAEAAEQARIAQEKAEAEEQARIAQEKAEAEEQARIAQEQAEAEEQARIAQEQAEAEEQARIAQEKAEAEEQARIAQEKAEAEEQARIAQEQAEAEAQEQAEIANELTQEKPEKTGFFSRLKKGLLKTRSNIGSGFASLFRGKKIDDELFEELETQLLSADVGVDTTVKLIDSLTDAADRKQLQDGDALYELLKAQMSSMLASAEQALDIEKSDGPFVILMVGVNGVGKTTTIGKLAKQYQQQGKSVMLAAGDTFRAAAVEQLQVWGERNDIPVIAQHTGADSASVVFDAYQAAKARNVDVLIADTAGRLQNKDNLMQELEKIARVMKKIDENAPHEVMLTIDAGTGQNAISQVKLFNQAVGLSGITLTKLDGTAKGGVIFAVADQFNIPIRYIGVGESIDDLRTFKSDDFIEALFSGE